MIFALITEQLWWSNLKMWGKQTLEFYFSRNFGHKMHEKLQRWIHCGHVDMCSNALSEPAAVPQFVHQEEAANSSNPKSMKTSQTGRCFFIFNLIVCFLSHCVRAVSKVLNPQFISVMINRNYFLMIGRNCSAVRIVITKNKTKIKTKRQT